MTAHSLDNLWSLPAGILTRFEHGTRFDAKRLALVDETVALRRCALYRDGFKDAAVSYPGAFLGFDALAAWIRRDRVTVDVSTAGRLDRAVAAGSDPKRIVIHLGNGTWRRFTQRSVPGRQGLSSAPDCLHHRAWPHSPIGRGGGLRIHPQDLER
jgi:hypothetical protein